MVTSLLQKAGIDRGILIAFLSSCTIVGSVSIIARILV